MRISDWSSDVCSAELGIDIADADIARQLEPAIGIFVVSEAQHQIGVEVALADDLDFLRQEIGSRDHARALRGRPPTIGCEIGRAQVCTPATNAPRQSLLLLYNRQHTMI